MGHPKERRYPNVRERYQSVPQANVVRPIVFATEWARGTLVFTREFGERIAVRTDDSKKTCDRPNELHTDADGGNGHADHVRLVSGGGSGVWPIPV